MRIVDFVFGVFVGLGLFAYAQLIVWRSRQQNFCIRCRDIIQEDAEKHKEKQDSQATNEIR